MRAAPCFRCRRFVWPCLLTCSPGDPGGTCESLQLHVDAYIVSVVRKHEWRSFLERVWNLQTPAPICRFRKREFAITKYTRSQATSGVIPVKGDKNPTISCKKIPIVETIMGYSECAGSTQHKMCGCDSASICINPESGKNLGHRVMALGSWRRGPNY